MARNPYTLDFAPINNALAAWQKQRNSDREFEAQNYLANEQLGIQKQNAARQQAEYDRQNAVRGEVTNWLAQNPNVGGVPQPLVDLSRIQGDASPVQQFLLAEAKRRAALSGPEEFGKTGVPFQGPDGRFYTVQFGSRGQRIVKPVEVDGTPLTPARGVFQVGDELTDKATGMPVRNVAPQLANEEIAKGEGKNIAKTRAELPEARQRLTMITGNLDRLKQTALNVRDHKGINLVVGGLYQAYAPNVSEDARNAGTELENLKVQISGTVLQAMRDASKTGGAVGQVTEREWPRLENMLANLDPRQGRQQFMQNLAAIITYVDQVKAALQQAYEADVAVASRGGGAVTPSAPQRLRFNPQTGELE